MSHQTVQSKLHEFENVCRDNGIKLTHQRLEIYKALLSFKGHPSVEDVFEKVRQLIPTISLDTVYRTMGSFEDLGLIIKLHTVDSKSRIDLNLEPHHHLICEKCKKVTDFHWNDFNDITVPSEVGDWGDISSKHLEIRGLCKDCQV